MTTFLKKNIESFLFLENCDICEANGMRLGFLISRVGTIPVFHHATSESVLSLELFDSLMAHKPTPVQSFLGGIGLSIPVHILLLFNGSAFGVSGFIHSAVRGSIENLASVSGLVLGGLAVGLVDGKGHGPEPVSGGLIRVGAAGLLVGLGTKARFPEP
jgi:hypothetical protein